MTTPSDNTAPTNKVTLMHKNIRLRPVSVDDLDLVESIHEAAFSKSEFGYSGEGQLVWRLHKEGHALVSLIAEVNGSAVGHVLFSQIQAEADGMPVIAAALAPLGVVPAWRHRGIGSLLITAGMAALKPQGVQLCVAVGTPGYYPRFGFDLELAKPFACAYSGPYFMASKLDPNFKQPTSGKLEFPAAFESF
jgi:putative acetyltransferase